MKLYHYEHCPFCQRVRLLLGYKQIPYESVVLSYDDADTPTKLIGKKMLPIMDFGDGTVMAESIDILREIENRHPRPIAFVGPVEPHLQWAAMAAVGIPRYFDLLLPAYADSYSEFDRFEGSKAYFQTSKEQKRSKTFAQLKEEGSDIYEQNILPRLEEIIEKVEDAYFIMGPTFSVADCVLAADLSGLRLVEGIELPPQIPAYIARVERQCNVHLLEP